MTKVLKAGIVGCGGIANGKHPFWTMDNYKPQSVKGTVYKKLRDQAVD